MLRLFIADDDRIIRRGLRAIIEEFASEFVIVGEAANGAIALDSIQKTEVDVLITDIKMPVMNGVELIKAVRGLDLKLKIIVLSGFDEYKYVRETMKYGAVDYLLKPVENDALLELLRKVGNDISIEVDKERESRIFSKNIAESMEVLKERFLKEIIRGDNNPSCAYEQRLKELGINEGKQFILVIVNRDDTYTIKKSLSGNMFIVGGLQKHPIYNTLKGKYENSILIAEDNGSVLVLFISAEKDPGNFKTDILTTLSELKESIRASCNFSVTMGISGLIYSLNRADFAYNQALFALQRRFYEGKDRLIEYISGDCCYDRINESQLNEQVETLFNFIEIGDSNKVKKSILALLDKLDKNNIEPAQYREICSNIVRKISALSREFKDIIENSGAEELDLIYFIEELDTLSELRDFVSNGFCKITEKINAVRSERSKRIIEIAKDYIQNHYNSDISLKAVAEHIYLNPTYFSELFKNETGENFIDYLIETRISIAKKLLAKPEIKVYEVSQMVGYDEPVSFNRVFKKVVGVSPSEYRSIIK